jgi:DNA replication and repair protein RecF
VELASAPVGYAEPERSAEAGAGITAVTVRDFRSYERAELKLGSHLTVIVGPNGVGKTNLLEALYCGCTGRSFRAAHEREMVRFGASSTRIVVECVAPDGDHELTVAVVPGEPKRLRIDGAPAMSLTETAARPLLTVFLPDRLELIKGTPAHRRAHLDQLVAALWPTRLATRRSYAQALAQRNALIGRIRSHGGGRASLETWDLQLAQLGISLMADRRAAVDAIAEGFSRTALELGLDREASVIYRPRSKAQTPAELAAELSARVESDLERGFTGHGPHRDELALQRDGRELRIYGSQGQQRLALLALLLCEREAIARLRGALPVALLDDVMSELDYERRQALIRRLRSDGGQAVITASELVHVPATGPREVAVVAVSPGGKVEAVEPGQT